MVNTILVLASVLADIGGMIGLAAALSPGMITRVSVLPQSVAETTCPLLPVGKRNTIDLTGENCASICGGVAGSGPNQADCNQIIDALYAQNTTTFTVGPYSVASWVQASCTIEFVQSTADTVTEADSCTSRYTNNDFAAVASYLASACNAANGYAEGNCIFDGRQDAIWVGNTAVSGQWT